MTTYEKVNWPFDSEAAKTIECYVTKAPRAKLYVWKDTDPTGYWPNIWHFTMEAGANGDRSHTGTLGSSELEPSEAVRDAIAAVKKSNSWNP